MMSSVRAVMQPRVQLARLPLELAAVRVAQDLAACRG